jgi:hypothetical protein
MNLKRVVILAALLVSLTVSLVAQTPTPSPTPFPTSSVSFSLTPITLPSVGTTLAGAETDTLFHFTTNNLVGATILVSSSTFVGGRYNRIFPSVSTWLQNHTALQGNLFEVGVTASGGVVESAKTQWGGRGGFFVNYALNNSWAMGFEAQANYLPGLNGTQKWVPSIAVGPSFHF